MTALTATAANPMTITPIRFDLIRSINFFVMQSNYILVPTI